MKERILSICLLLLAAITVWAIVAELPRKEYATPSTRPLDDIPADTSPSVAGEVIRLHILADSDSTMDQTVKLAVRDALLPYLNAATLTADTKEEAMTLLKEQCSVFQEVADTTLSRLGMDYTASVSVDSLYFPIRIYGSQTYLSEDAVLFPPGYYDSVQVILGEGNGHNWWCLAFPSLCFIDAAYDYIPKDSALYKTRVATVEKSTLDKLFYGSTDTEIPEYSNEIRTEYETLLMEQGVSAEPEEDDTVTVYFGSRLWELIKELFS
ncbi:MAG: stage II sporulation protein R [Lachnospiraceae bacterium]|nr:stage II sporulation protein R [Lachnospiraceae bacterium]